MNAPLPEAVRKEKEGWRERLFVRVAPRTGELPKLTKRQVEVWNIIEEWRELSLQELLALAETTAETVTTSSGPMVIEAATAKAKPAARKPRSAKSPPSRAESSSARPVVSSPR